jgi:septum formation protein
MPFDVAAGEVDETIAPGATPEQAVLDLAERKARAAFGQGARGVIVGADTVVALAGEILGKPADDAAALAMLRRLGGRAHEVWTGLAVIDAASGRTEPVAVRSVVRMRAVSDDEWRAYVATGEGRDKAGGYAIQGGAAEFVIGVEGCWLNVVGFPLCEVAALLTDFGVAIPAAGPVCTLPGGAPCPRLSRG